MRIVKSLLLGSAAGLVAVAGAQAADLPVKAKPVEYVKICNLYGDGFFYIPGTETCLRVGGSVQADYDYNMLSNGHPHYDAAQGAQDRTVSAFAMRTRMDIALDARTQTQYGTLRTFLQFRDDNGDANVNTLNEPRAFIQWAGFTFGHTRSYSDPYATHGGGDGFGMLTQAQNHPDSGANGTNQISYTWELGNGAVIVIGADERRNNSLTNLSLANQVTVGTAPTTSRAGMMFPDPYVTFRMSQAWGNFSAAIHTNQNSAQYYSVNTPGFGACTAQPLTTFCDHPADKMGWAFMGGLQINLPMVAAGDRFGTFFTYGVGASQYAAGNSLQSPGLFGGGNNVALGVKTDGVYLNGTGIEMTTGWSIGMAYEHWWMPTWKTTLFLNHAEISYDNTVIASRAFCGGPGAGAQQIQVGAGVVCDPGFKYSDIRLGNSWYPSPGFRLGFEVGYTMIDTAFSGQQVTLTKATGARPAGAYTAKDLGITNVTFRANRGFGGIGE